MHEVVIIDRIVGYCPDLLLLELASGLVPRSWSQSVHVSPKYVFLKIDKL